MTDHLTTIEGGGLTPINIIQAAQADMKLAAKKAERKADDDKPYSFHRRHLRRARGNMITLLAIAYCEETPPTDKRSTMIIYRDREVLKQALIHILNTEPA